MKSLSIRPVRRMFGMVPALTLLIVTLVLSTSFSQAQDTTPTDPEEAAVALMESLTPEQQATISTILSTYEAELADLAEQSNDSGAISQDNTVYLPMIIGTQDAVIAQEPAVATTPTGTSARVAEIMVEMNDAITAVLTPEQLELYQVVVSVEAQAEAAAVLAVEPLDEGATTSGAAPALSLSGCVVAAQYSAYAHANAVAAKSYAFMAWFDVLGSNTTNAFLAYDRLNDAQNYALSAFKNISASYINLTVATTPAEVNGTLGFYGTRDAVFARDAAINGAGYAFDDYVFTLNYFSFYAWQYGLYVRDYSNTAASLSDGNCY